MEFDKRMRVNDTAVGAVSMEFSHTGWMSEPLVHQPLTRRPAARSSGSVLGTACFRLGAGFGKAQRISSGDRSLTGL